MLNVTGPIYNKSGLEKADSAEFTEKFSADRFVIKNDRDDNHQPLRVVAVAPPDSVHGRKDENALNSSDPASLFNACRVAAQRALFDTGAWQKSNWGGGGRSKIRANIQLMNSLDDLPEFVCLLKREKPNVLLLGAMTLCMPGAIACANVAREIFGKDIMIVLGGRHASETIYLWNAKARQPEDIIHHRASPSRLIRSGRIPPVFDAVVSGEGEFVIAELGEIVAQERGPYNPREIFHKLDIRTPGNWIVSLPGEGCDIVSVGNPIDPNDFMSLARLFGVTASFEIFGGKLTAHVFSDVGPGCVYDCEFCSERRSVTGGLKDVTKGAGRLYRQLDDAVSVIEEDCPGRGASAFVEDSVLLGGSPRALDELCELLENAPLPIEFGAQLTVDQVLTRQPQLARLARVGLTYLFIGLETIEPNDIGGMSKDIGGKIGNWEFRSKRALDILSQNHINCGCALLFGLGERHESRLRLLDYLTQLRGSSGQPCVLSANWAVHHPLRNTVRDPGYDYVDWGTPAGPFVDLFQNFGEASLIYPLIDQKSPDLREVREVVDRLHIFRRCWPGPAR